MLYLALWACFGGSVVDLGDEDCRVREAAHARLARNAPIAWRLLDYPFRDPERDWRAREVVRDYLAPGTTPPITDLIPGTKSYVYLFWWYRIDDGLHYRMGSEYDAPYRSPTATATARPYGAWVRVNGRGPASRLARHYLARATRGGAAAAAEPHLPACFPRRWVPQVSDDWYSIEGARRATRLLYRDLAWLGVPPALLRGGAGE